MESTSAKATQKASKVEIIFEQLATIENKTFGIKSTSKNIKQKLLGVMPETEENPTEVPKEGILQSIIEQLKAIRDNLQHSLIYLDEVAEEIKKK